MSIEEQKEKVGRATLEYIKSGDIVGVGTGSTVNYFIDALGDIKSRIDGAVASSEATCQRLEQMNIPVLELNQTGRLPIYIDGADEADSYLRLIKGGGGALTREKIIANASRQFICIADESKLVDTLGKFPLPIEVLPMAQSSVAREIVAMDAVVELRQQDGQTFITDNGNVILDVRGLDITNPLLLETQINQLPGVVCVGLFAHRPADILLLATDTEVKTLSRHVSRK